VFTEEGSETSTSVSSGRAAWSVVHRVLETPESFLFFISNSSFSVFPKRCLQSEGQIEVLRGLIRQCVGAKAKLEN